VPDFEDIAEPRACHSGTRRARLAVRSPAGYNSAIDRARRRSLNPETEKFEVFPKDRRGANVRQILGRPGEVWAPESGTNRLVVYRTK
jgi:hypothetical protein